jgi:serine/threonine protein kinase
MPEEKTEDTASAAVAAAPEQPAARTCPNCGAVHSEQELARANYRCGCGLELAYLETTPTGATRGVLGWLHRPGDVVLERYRVEKVLGKGGFAATYLVEDLRLNGKKRAIKEIPELLYDETETEMLSHLSHPSIPDIIDRARVAGMVYLVLEFGGGRTLENERRSRGGRIPLDTLLPWLQQLGEVIGYLHSQDPPVIHRDLKPDNVLLDQHDRIMLIDFGIAKQSAESGGTRTIARAATQGYSPPEQALGTGTDPRSDVYALAATAYTLLTGQVPPAAHERVAGTELAPPSQLVPEIPAHIGDTLVQALNLNINRRPATIEQLLQPLGAAAPATTGFTPITSQTLRVGDLPPEYTKKAASVRIHSDRVTIAPTTGHPKRSRRGLWAFVGLVLVAAGAGGLWFFQEPIRERLFPEEPTTSDSGGETSTEAPETALQPPDRVTPTAEPDTQAPASVAVQPPTPAPVETSTPVPTPAPTSVQLPPQAPVDTPTGATATAAPAPAAAAVQTATLPPSTPPSPPPTTAAGSVQAPPRQPPGMPGTFPKPAPSAQPQAAGRSAMSAFESRRAEALKEKSAPQDSAEAVVTKTPPVSRPKKKKPTRTKQPTREKPVKKQATSGWSATYLGTTPKD